MSAQEVLFDAPGPRGRRRIRVGSAVALAAIAALAYLAVARFAAHGQLAADKWQHFTNPPIIRFLLIGLLDTLKAAGVSMAMALPAGLLIALGRLSRFRPVRLAAGAYAETFRTVPLLLMMLFFLLALPHYGVTLPVFWLLVLPLVITNAAMLGELFRAGILSLERGQVEAAYSIGLSQWQAMWIVVVPQAVRRLAPALVSQLVLLLKGTSLGYVVSYNELLNSGKILGQFTHTLIQTYIVVAVIYVIVNTTLSQLSRRLETRQRRWYGRARAEPAVREGSRYQPVPG